MVSVPAPADENHPHDGATHLSVMNPEGACETVSQFSNRVLAEFWVGSDAWMEYDWLFGRQGVFTGHQRGVTSDVVLPAGKDCAQAPRVLLCPSCGVVHADHQRGEQHDQQPVHARRAQQGSRGTKKRRTQLMKTKHPFPRPHRNSTKHFDEVVYSWCISECLRDMRAADRAGVERPGLEVLADAREQDIWTYGRRYVWVMDSNNPGRARVRRGEVQQWVNEDRVGHLVRGAAAFALEVYDPARLLVEQEAGRRGGLKASHPKRFAMQAYLAVKDLSAAAAAKMLGCSVRTVRRRRAELRVGEQWERALAARAATGRTGPHVVKRKRSVPLIVGVLDLGWLDRVRQRRGGREAWRFGLRQRARMSARSTQTGSDAEHRSQV